MNGAAVLASYLCRDHVGLAGFYASAFGWPSIEAVESPIFTALDSGRFAVGFHHDDAHDLLDIGARRDEGGSRMHLTIEVGTFTDVDAAVEPLVRLGATVVKAPFTTYYDARQVVLEDPEGNLFRISSTQDALHPTTPG
ncbi:MAG: Glyoxalase/bleomycin resistance protein/dioxygenase [Acidimicrobiales bacterium]|nr:Glyoxalase/bleomycin resistance protein/dioxygenase [Acidimicrobiales bacterium]